MKPSIHSGAAILLFTSMISLQAAGAGTAAGEQPVCESRAPAFGDERTATCRFAAMRPAQQVSFKVRFSGSHDDTQLSITASLNNLPLTCGPGSKTSSRFEDGEIALECRFLLHAQVGSGQVLEVRILWTHAQYGDFELTLQ